MIATKKDLEATEKKVLAPYATLSSQSAGRRFPETEDETRTAFQRDRDRIIHSKPFRRLSGKTQVFVATYGDHFRDRLTHSLEVAQIARDLARSLRLNEDLCEAIALAHDLGHTPFGHAGEEALDKIMQKFGGHFEHNEQSKRAVEVLEKQFPNFDGLNLSAEVLAGLAKHQTHYDNRGKKIVGTSLEAQVVDIADEIAYQNHDIDDGLRSKLFRIEDLMKIDLCRKSAVEVRKKYGEKMDADSMRRRFVSNLISMMIADTIANAENNIKNAKIQKPEDAVNRKEKTISFSPAFAKRSDVLREFLWTKMYQSPRVKRHSERGARVIEKLFNKLYKKPDLLPKRFRDRINAPDPLEVVVKDYVAGCTDIYAMSKMQTR
jgi:dGTPase